MKITVVLLDHAEQRPPYTCTWGWKQIQFVKCCVLLRMLDSGQGPENKSFQALRRMYYSYCFSILTSCITLYWKSFASEQAVQQSLLLQFAINGGKCVCSFVQYISVNIRYLLTVFMENAGSGFLQLTNQHHVP